MVDRMEPRRKAADLERRIAAVRGLMGPLGCGFAIYFVVLILLIGLLSSWVSTVPWLVLLAVVPLAGAVLLGPVLVGYLKWLQSRLAVEEARVRLVDMEAALEDGESDTGWKPEDPPPPTAP